MAKSDHNSIFFSTLSTFFIFRGSEKLNLQQTQQQQLIKHPLFLPSIHFPIYTILYSNVDDLHLGCIWRSFATHFQDPVPIKIINYYSIPFPFYLSITPTFINSNNSFLSILSTSLRKLLFSLVINNFIKLIKFIIIIIMFNFFID